jgi:hypothetical protein
MYRRQLSSSLFLEAKEEDAPDSDTEWLYSIIKEGDMSAFVTAQKAFADINSVRFEVFV